MSDPLANIVPGTYSPFVTRAATVNAVLEAARRVRRGERGTTGASPELDPLAPAVTVWVRNDTGATLPEFSVVALGTPLTAPADAPLEVQEQPLFPGTAPAAASDPFAVTRGPVAAGELVRAAVLGVAVCDVTVTAAGHGYAEPAAGATASLSSAGAGPAKVIWRAGGLGTQRAVVLLQGDMGLTAGDATDGSGGGSGGSGSGDAGSTACEAPVTPASVACTSGVRTLTVTQLSVGRDGSAVRLAECGTVDIPLGPCSPYSPGGYNVPVPINFCLDVDAVEVATPGGGTTVVNSVRSFTATFGVIGAATFDLVGCRTFDPVTGGAGSGSGSGGCCDSSDSPPTDCIVTPTCPEGLSSSFTISVGGEDIVLTYLNNPSNGNPDQFFSPGGLWALFRTGSEEDGTGAWILENTQTGQVWVNGDVFDAPLCGGASGALFYPMDPTLAPINVTADNDCSTFTWNCVDGVCTSVSGTGGTYATQAACLAACGDGPPPGECGCETYSVDGVSMPREGSVCDVWQSSPTQWRLERAAGTDHWQLINQTGGGCVYVAAGWDGAGARVFTDNGVGMGCGATQTVTCVSPPT